MCVYNGISVFMKRGYGQKEWLEWKKSLYKMRIKTDGMVVSEKVFNIRE